MKTISTDSDLTLWHQCVANMLDSESDSQRIYELLRGAESLVRGNSSMAIIYPTDGPPQITHHRLLANERLSTQVDRYIEGAYLFDPFYRAAVDDNREGFYLLREVAPDAFGQTEYFRRYYREANLGDEACFLVRGADGVIASLSIGRASDLGGGRFSPLEVSRLKSLLPVVENILRKWIHNHNGCGAQLESFGNRLESALNNFGRSLLTNRECEVLHMTMRGHSIKSMAEKLDASVDTIKTHRKHIYSKLDVTSQSELFYLFISALRHHSGTDLDPLTSLER
ncbi:helix-turn-helix transcriptional regulator [Microbulbifer bruguierae]|uniref:Helix-turn-helix transcriptional regulator n=1 Tax=Microbulbifer bruguierae TaxID=3029061 RepID=A0ABY8ND08_9GAMM|nr:helix-turn-helix transcriptional regulator [Microbulbifer bruguierae]WGL15318.1 helix-turn-helix transcriptional regulator [Microbulbifer bruguierae]